MATKLTIKTIVCTAAQNIRSSKKDLYRLAVEITTTVLHSSLFNSVRVYRYLAIFRIMQSHFKCVFYTVTSDF